MCVLSLELSSLANISTIAACFVAIVGFVFGVWQFSMTQKSTRESQAVELFSKFNQLNIDLENSEENYESHHWYRNSMFAITEALYEISRHSDNWEHTVKWMLCQQEKFIREGGFELNSYSPQFRDFCKKSGYELKLKGESNQSGDDNSE
jgi:hypothetical protein